MAKQVDWKMPAILAGALVVLGTLAYWHEFTHVPQKEQSETRSKMLFPIADQTVEEIIVANKNGSVHLRCLDSEKDLCQAGQQSEWEIVDPIKTNADASNVSALLSSMNNLKSSGTLDLGPDSPEKRARLLNEYGLGEKDIKEGQLNRITYKVKGKKPQTVYFGGEHSIQKDLFALKGDDTQLFTETVYLSPPYFKHNFDHELIHWRNKRIFKFTTKDVKKFKIENTLKGRPRTLTAARDGSNWNLKIQSGRKTDSVSGDVENLQAFATALAFLSAREFGAEEKSSPKASRMLRKAKSQGSVQIWTQDDESKPIRLELFREKSQSKEKDDTYYARASNKDALYILDPSLVSLMEKPITHFRKTTWITAAEKNSIQKVEISGKAHSPSPVVLRMQPENWVQLDSKGQLTDQKLPKSQIDTLLDNMSGDKIKNFLTSSQIPRRGQSQGITISLYDGTDQLTHQALFWKKSKKSKTLYMKNLLSQRKEAFEFEPNLANNFPWDKKFFQWGKKDDKPKQKKQQEHDHHHHH